MFSNFAAVCADLRLTKSAAANRSVDENECDSDSGGDGPDSIADLMQPCPIVPRESDQRWPTCYYPLELIKAQESIRTQQLTFQ